MKLAKVSFVNEPSVISRARILSSESAGKMEYLAHILENQWRNSENFTSILGQKMTFEQLSGLRGHNCNLSPYTCQWNTYQQIQIALENT
jgi:hypothetical protein